VDARKNVYDHPMPLSDEFMLDCARIYENNLKQAADEEGDFESLSEKMARLETLYKLIKNSSAESKESLNDKTFQEMVVLFIEAHDLRTFTYSKVRNDPQLVNVTEHLYKVLVSYFYNQFVLR
jgi:hypothetical protein